MKQLQILVSMLIHIYVSLVLTQDLLGSTKQALGCANKLVDIFSCLFAGLHILKYRLFFFC